MRTHIKFALMTLGLILTAAPPLLAQKADPVVSPAKARTTVSADIAALVDGAYPVYDDSTLAGRLSAAARTLGDRSDTVIVRSVAGIERVMGFVPSGSTGTEVDTPTANYRVNAATGKAFAVAKNDSYQGLTADRFAPIEGRLQVMETAFLGSLGLPSDEVMKISYRRILAQSLVADSQNNSDGSPTLVRRGVTLASRGFGGFPIENSEVRVSSFNGSQVDLFGLRWPKFQPHRQALSVVVAPVTDIKRDIIAQVTQAVQPGDPISLYMGVVFRPVRTVAGQLVYVPQMKVMVTPQPKLVSLAGGDLLTEAGAVLYVNLFASPPTDIVTQDQSDVSSPGR